MINSKTNRKIIFLKFLKNLIVFLILILALFTYFFSSWFNKTFQSISFDEILYHLSLSLKGAKKEILFDFIIKLIVPAFFLSIVIILINYKINKNIIKNKNLILKIEKFKIFNFLTLFERNKDYLLKLKFRKKNFAIAINRKIILVFMLILKISLIFLIFQTSLKNLNFKEYLEKFDSTSNFIEKNYISPEKVNLTFPKNKQNLIYIFAESLESTFFSKNLGGNENQNILKPLTKLTEKNINFSNTKNFGGAYPVFGTNFTTAGIVAQTLAIPLKMEKKIVNNHHLSPSFLKNFYGLGNILEKEGYYQIFLMGSNKKFGNKDILLKNHGNYKILDHQAAIKEGFINKNYKVWWGFEDSKLFNIAKKKLLDLQEKNIPFNLTILTSNTHFPGGFIEKKI